MLQIFAYNNEQMGELKNQYAKTVNPNKQRYYKWRYFRELTGKINQLAKNNQQVLSKINNKLKVINDEQKAKYEKGDKGDTLHVAQLNQKAEGLIKEFRELQEKFTNTVKDNVRRQANFIQGDTTEE